MRASSGTYSDSSLPLTLASANSGDGATPPAVGTSATFEDIFQQEGGTPSNPPDLKTKAPISANNLPDQPTSSVPAASSETIEKSDPSTATPVTSPAGTTAEVIDEIAAPTTAPIKSKSTTISEASDLSTMLVRAAVFASNAQQAPVAKVTSNSAPANKTQSGSDSNPGTASAKDGASPSSAGPDLSNLMVQALILASNASQPSVQNTLSLSTISSASLTSAANALLVSVPTTTMTSSKEIPSLGASYTGTATPAKEKKSAVASSEWTFLHSDTTGSSTDSNILGLLSAPSVSISQSSVNQSLTTGSESANLSLNSVSGSASGLTGTANVEKEKAMNATFNFPEILSSYGTNTASQHTAVDMHIQLSTNNDFEDALKQVMHVAQLTQTNESRTPMRVAMEIQTPPGAIVNVYVSRQNDQWRAQLSTNDPQALSWVQDKMSSLRQSNDLGMDVRWLPPQMEATSTSSSGDSGLAWDRGGQGQQGSQSQDERQQPARQKKTELFAGIGTGQFMEALTALRSAS